MKVTAQEVQNEIRFTIFSAGPKWMKLTAKEQRSLFFGKYLFGKKDLKVKPWGIETKKRVAFGQDYDIQGYTWEEIAQMINS